jgi:opacity protein-like surface antigen
VAIGTILSTNVHLVSYRYGFGVGKLEDFNASGPTVGGGIEKKLSPKWSLRAECRYTNFVKHRFSTKSRTTQQRVRLRL